MKALAIFILLLGVSTPSILYSQKKNRISIQTGMFHQFFDGTLLVNKTVVTENTHQLMLPEVNFDGQSGTALASDPTGAVGPNHYFHAVITTRTKHH